ncbi:GNAT family N-acetyltransferase [Streptomyces sp. NBC_00320]|uniref:GNAT family N-acetyltransferase n=1 Tax=unclassified Streptomyces TaxID=2593676 RepID=UPI0022516AB5|nr:GNAT family N-acetyltransferase [Streptomyces sp. NBC_00320]MCX5151942.1 GNAT family N-acetyltransferase [Streptomyces sp. NBC_00320]
MTIMGSDAVDRSVSLTAQALRRVAELDWSAPAADLEWSCYDTAVHVASDFTGYATQLTGRSTSGYAPFDISADPGTTPTGLIQVIEATGGLLSAAVAVTGPEVRAWHPYGMAGPDGFAAMGVVETLLHTHDILVGLGVRDWEPDADLCEQVLLRLFPQAPRDLAAPWPTLLWVTGRAGLPGLPRHRAWRWYAEPIATERVVLCEISPLVAGDLRDGGTGGFAWAEDGPGEGTRVASGMVAKAREEGTFRPGWGAYAIVRTQDRRAIGGIGFHGAPDAEGNAEIGYDLVPAARGNGYATEALKGLVGWALGQPGVTALHARVDADNAPSHGVVVRAGFERTGSTEEGEARYTLRAAAR